MPDCVIRGFGAIARLGKRKDHDGSVIVVNDHVASFYFLHFPDEES